MRQVRGKWVAQLTVDFLEGGSGHKSFQLAVKGDGPVARKAAEAERDEYVRVLAAHPQKFPKRGRGRIVKPATEGSSPGTFGEYFDRWKEHRKGEIATGAKDVQRVKDHVLDVPVENEAEVRMLMRDVPMKSLETDQQPLRDVAAALKAKAKNPAIKRFKMSTAGKVWESLTALFGCASQGNAKGLRALKMTPTSMVKSGLKVGKKPVKQWLFPREFSRLVECTDAPLSWRQAYAVATYLLLRVAELRGLWCEDIDLESRTVHVHRGAKKNSDRTFRYEDAIHPLLVHLVAEAGGRGPLFDLREEVIIAAGRAPQKQKIGAGKQAARLRDHLVAAGVTRHALHHSEERSCRVTFHDLRATGITWMAIRGDSLLQIRDRAGHEDAEQTNGYMRRASMAGNVGAAFPSLAALVPFGDRFGDQIETASSSLMKTGTYEWSRGGSNPSPSPPSTENVGVYGVETTANSPLGRADRYSDRQWEPPSRPGPTRQTTPAAWALTLALEGALARAEHRGRAPEPRPVGAPLAAVASHGKAVPQKGARRAG